MVANQFNPTIDGGNSSSPGDDLTEDVIDGEATPEQLQEAADALNGVTEAPAEPAPYEPPMSSADKARQDIAEKNRERRMAEMVEGAGVGPDDNAENTGLDDDQLNQERLYYGDLGSENKNFMGEDIVPADAQLEPVTPAPTVEPGADAGDLVTVTVDGQEQQISQQELVRNFQINQAAEKRMQEATHLLQQAQSVAAAQLQPTATADAQATDSDQSPTEPAPTNADVLDGIDFAAISEKIQLGETEEGANALKDLVVQVMSRTAPSQDAAQVNPADQIEHVVTAVQDRQQSDAARREFEENFADIVSDPHLNRMSQAHAHEAIIEDFAANGADENMIAMARANPAQAFNAHRAMRLSGQFPELKNPHQLYQEAGTRTRSWLEGISGGTPNPNPVVNTGAPRPEVPRDQRQRAAQQSPGRRQQPPRQRQQAPAVKTPSQVIQEMKVARGQYPAGTR